MPSTFDILDLLDRHGVFDDMQLSRSPWPDVDMERDDVYPIDWRRLFRPDDARYPDYTWDEGMLPPPGAFDDSLGPGCAPDYLAWYQPIHFYGPDWGIYIREDGIASVATSIARVSAGRMSYLECVRAAIATLFLHEAHHHKVESFALRLLAARERPAYPTYIARVFLRLRGSDDLLEEALANAESWRRLNERAYAIGDTAAVRRYLERDFRNAPPGYRRAPDYLANVDFRIGQATLLNQVAAGSPKPSQDVADWLAVNRMYQSLFDVSQNFWTVVPKGTVPALPIVTPPRYATNRIVRALKDAGYSERHGAKHRKFKSTDGPTVHLSRRPEQPPHVARQVARAVGTSVAELS